MMSNFLRPTRRDERWAGMCRSESGWSTRLALLFAISTLTPKTAALFQPPDPGTLLATVAKLVLQARLREAGSVDVDVKASPASLLSGGIDGVRVCGRRWCTPMRLSCSGLRMDVGATAIDQSALMSERRIALKKPALGSAIIEFTESDWDNFLLHPLMAQAITERSKRSSAPNFVSFNRARSRIIPATADKTGAVEFSCKWADFKLRARLSQDSKHGRVVVVATPEPLAAEQNSEAATAAAKDASAWLAPLFASLVIDLDGCALTFRALEVVGKASPELRFELDVCVRSFPSIDINF